MVDYKIYSIDKSIDDELNFIKDDISYMVQAPSDNTYGYNTLRSNDPFILNRWELKKIKNFCQNMIDVYTSQKSIIQKSWVLINPPGSKVLPHIHPDSDIVGMFYFQITPDSPRLLFNRRIKDNKTLRWEFEEVNHSVDEMTNGDVILFGDGIEQSVPMNETDTDIISLAFNAKYKI